MSHYKVLLVSVLGILLLSPGGLTSSGGENWTSIGLSGTSIYALAVDPRTPSTLYAATERQGVFKSTNRGAVWSAVNTGLTNAFVRGLVIDPANPATVYAAIHYGDRGAPEIQGGVYKSTDGGETWSSANNGLAGVHVNALAMDSLNPTTLYAATYYGEGGVFKSTDGGASWTAANTGLPTTGVNTLVIGPTDQAIVYAATNSGILKSTNGGQSWKWTA